jgi:hypothetical protein
VSVTTVTKKERGTEMKILLLICLPALLAAQMFPFPGPKNASGGGGAPTAPTFVSATSNQVAYVAGSNTFPLTSVTTASGDLVWVFAGTHSPGNSCNVITGATSTIGGSASGDTFTQVQNPSNGNQCAISFIAYNVHAGSGNYAISINAPATGPGSLQYSIMVFHPGSLTATDTYCSGSAVSYSVACSTAMSPGASLELVLTGLLMYDPLGSTAANSPYSIPTGGTWDSGNFSTASVAVAYYIANPTSGTYTPGFSSIGSGDGGSVIGVMVK